VKAKSTSKGGLYNQNLTILILLQNWKSIAIAGRDIYCLFYITI
jgi:hypothetical protein